MLNHMAPILSNSSNTAHRQIRNGVWLEIRISFDCENKNELLSYLYCDITHHLSPFTSVACTHVIRLTCNLLSFIKRMK